NKPSDGLNICSASDLSSSFHRIALIPRTKKARFRIAGKFSSFFPFRLDQISWRPYGMDESALLARRHLARNSVERLEGDRLARQCGVFFTLLCAMVRHGKAQARSRAFGFLVVEPDWFAFAS